jgi:hypothetical protein
MARLADLPVRTQRKLALEWQDLLTKYHFTGEHARWHEKERSRRHRIMLQMPIDREYRGNPNAVGSVGFRESVEIASERFEQLKRTYLQVWAASAGPEFEEFEGWLGVIVASVICEIEQLWSGLSDWHTAWFAKVCKKGVEKELKKLAGAEVNRIRRLEIQHLENRALSMSDLIASKGDINTAILFRESRLAVDRRRPLEHTDVEARFLEMKTTESRKALPRENPISTQLAAGLESERFPRANLTGDGDKPLTQPLSQIETGVHNVVQGVPHAQVARQQTGTSERTSGVESARMEAMAERAARRQAVVNPILQLKGWKPGRLATKAGVGKNSVYEYLDGTRAKIMDENREAIAQALGLEAEQLPD